MGGKKLKFKKLILAAASLSLIFGLAGCKLRDVNGGGNSSFSWEEESPSGGSPSTPSRPDGEEPTTFTVSLVCEGKSFDESVCPEVSQISAVWTNLDDSRDVNTAPVGENGQAVTELDGDYRVTLISLPEGYAYDCNSYFADNDNSNIEVEIFSIKQPGSTVKKDKKNWARISECGAYSVTFASAAELKRFRLLLTSPGVYTVETLCNVSENRIKPGMRYYPAMDSEITTYETVYTYSSQNSYTKNIEFQVVVLNDQVGRASYYFAMSAESKDAFPVTYEFAVRRVDNPPEGVQSGVVNSKWHFPDIAEPEGTFRLLASDNGRLLDQKMVERHDDGFYYLKDTDTLLYANLYGSLSVLGGANFKDVDLWPLDLQSVNGKNYRYMIKEVYYAHRVGVGYPVNDEIKQFLFDYSVSAQLFYDGLGTAEALHGYNSDYGSQWLFACGYYIVK